METGTYTPPPTALPAELREQAISVGGTALSEQDIARELQYHPADRLEDAWQAATTSLVIRELLANRANELNIQAASEEERTALLLERELQVPDPDESQCRRYFDSNRNRFHTPALLAVSHILLPAAPDQLQQREQQRLLAKELLQQVQANPGQFASLARQYSACPSSGQGGSLGQLSKGQTVAEFEQQVWALPVGLCPYPVETRFGFHLVQVEQRVEGTPQDFLQVAGRIRQYLHEQATRTALSQYLQMLAHDIGVEGIAFAAAGSPLVQ